MAAERRDRPAKKRSSGASRPARARKPAKPARPEQAVAAEGHALAQPVRPLRSVVGVGASAGGLEAFTRLLRALPADTGLAFVLVQHLSPTHESSLAEILSRATSMSVTEVADEPALEPDHVYVIPPDRNMTIVREHLRLLPREALGKQHPIDRFFCSLAENLGHQAIGVVLSGTATDGTLGLEEIKSQGGITFAQDDSAQQRGMPLSAVASGCVDFVLAPEAIAAEIVRISKHPYVVPSATPAPRAGKAPRSEAPLDEETYGPILQLLLAGTGVDFTHYKASTLLRRIRRRMVLQKKAVPAEYEQHLRDNPDELQALYQDILISVTSFFRDPETFEALKQETIPRLLRGCSRNDPLRVWVVGCSTGEEAYSLAMILSEAQEDSDAVPAQIFATDLNAVGIQRARAGQYSRERLLDVSPERLRRFFAEQSGVFRVSKPLRDMCVFSRHDILADPPFSRMDLVSCRNLLIYLDPSLQQKVIPLLHYALKPTGCLVLGASETVGRSDDLFTVEDGKHKIFAKKPGSGRLPVLPIQRAKHEPTAAVAEKPARAGAYAAQAFAAGATDVLKETDRLLASFAPPAVLVDAQFEVLQIRGNVDPYLAPGQGKASLAVLRMAREGLLVPLRAALERAKTTHAPTREVGLRVGPKQASRAVDLEVLPLERSGAHDACFLVLFKEAAAAARVEPAPPTRRRGTKIAAVADEPQAPDVTRLELELSNTRDYLQAVMEQFEVANEELQSSLEEIQSSNEELQSINEELETSKEEIQSSNEELTTVNDELQNRNLEVGQLNDDLTNLIANVELAIVIVGRDLRLRRFSPTAEKQLNIIASDVGRPIGNIRLNIVLPELGELLDEVIHNARPLDRSVQDQQGHWWSLRVRPYLTLENKIDGAVLMLVDIDVLKSTEQAVRAGRDYLRKWEQLFEHAGWAVATIHAGTTALELVNPAFARMHGYDVTELTGRSLMDLVAPESRQGLSELTHRAEEECRVYESVHLRKDGTAFPVLTQVTALRADDGHTLYHAATFEDITERKQLEGALQKRSEDLAAADSAKNQFISVLSHELRSPLNVILLWAHLLRRPGCSAEELRRGLDVIDQSIRAQSQLIEDLMDVHRITYGKVRLALSSVDLGGITRSLVESMTPASLEAGIAIELELAADSVLVSGDPARLQQVLRNLLDNALKFTPRGGRVRIGMRRREGCAEVSISDTGQGIAPEALPHVFELFRQPDPARSARRGGLGLGLSIAKHLVKLHGGKLTAASPGAGQGATFTVSLPLLILEVPPPVVLTEAPHPVSLAGVQVLVVDDEFDQREPLGLVLELAGAEVIAVASTDEALDALRVGLPDVIVSDIGMPDRDGYDLLRSVRALPAKRGGRIPAIALTAYASAEDRARTRAAGFQAHMGKPVESTELIAAVATLARVAENRGTPS